MIDWHMDLEDDHFINDGVFIGLEHIKWRAVGLNVDFGGRFLSFVGNNLVRDSQGNFFRKYRDNDLERPKFKISEISKISEMKADINSGLDCILIEVKLEFLHWGQVGLVYAWTKIKNCSLIMHSLIKCIICLKMNDSWKLHFYWTNKIIAINASSQNNSFYYNSSER